MAIFCNLKVYFFNSLNVYGGLLSSVVMVTS